MLSCVHEFSQDQDMVAGFIFQTGEKHSCRATLRPHYCQSLGKKSSLIVHGLKLAMFSSSYSETSCSNSQQSTGKER